jgi:hypothetical protein
LILKVLNEHCGRIDFDAPIVRLRVRLIRALKHRLER